jgi:response regulator RpfG family c-di-GMP phosphodiesterase
MAVADVYDALMSQRSYKESFTHAASRGIIVAERGKQFDPDVVDAFVALDAQFEAISEA